MSNDPTSCDCVDDVATFPAVANAPIVCTLRRDDMRARARDFMEAFERLVATERFATGFRWTFRKTRAFNSSRLREPSAIVQERARHEAGFARLQRRAPAHERGPNMMMPMPIRQTAAPMTSHRSGGCFSTSHPHAMAHAT